MNITEKMPSKKGPFWPGSGRGVLQLQNEKQPSSLKCHLSKMKFRMIINHICIVIQETE